MCTRIPSGSGFKYDFAEDRAGFDQFVPSSCFPERQDSIDHRPQLPAKHALHHIEKITMAAHC